jgi:hypothetical protein
MHPRIFHRTTALPLCHLALETAYLAHVARIAYLARYALHYMRRAMATASASPISGPWQKA